MRDSALLQRQLKSLVAIRLVVVTSVFLLYFLLSLLPDHVIMHTAWPQGPTRTRVVCDWLFDAGALAAPDFDPDDAVAMFDLVNRQDWEVCALTQQGMTSRAYRTGGVYAPSEHHLRAFNDFVLDRLA